MSLSRRALLASGAALMIYQPKAKSFWHGSLPASGTTTWNLVLFGAGGFARIIDIAPDGTRVVANDTCGAYVWNAATSKYLQLFNAVNFPYATFGIANGAWDISIAYSNTQIFYALMNGWALKSTDRGSTWNKCGDWTQDSTYNGGSTDSNGTYKLSHQHIRVDPNNPDVVYAWKGDAGGLWRTINGGVNWTNISPSLVPAGVNPGPGGCGLAFDDYDPHGTNVTTVSGQTRTATIYAPSWGNGVYQSTDGGITFSALNPASTTSVTITTTGTDRVIVVQAFINAQTLSAISDTSGLTWALRKHVLGNSGQTNVYEYWAHAPTAITTTITVTWSAIPANVFSLSAFAVINANTTTPFDTDASLPGSSTTSTSPTISTSNANDIVFTTLVATSNPSTDSGYTKLFSGAAPYRMFNEYQVFSSTQSSIQPGATGTLCGITDAMVSAGGALSLEASAPQSATLTSGSPVSITEGQCATWALGSTNGAHRYWVGTGRTGTGEQSFRYNDNSTWSEIKTNGTTGGSSYSANTVAPDNNTSGRVFLIDVGASGVGIQTLDGGTTTVGGGNMPQPTQVNTSDVAWQQTWINNNPTGNFWVPGAGMFDRSQSNFFYLAEGVGVNYYNIPSTAVAFKYNIQTLGIESLIPRASSARPGYPTIFGFDDRGSMVLSNPNTPPSNYLGSSNGLRRATDVDYASSDPSYGCATGCQGSSGGDSGFSTDNGATWKLFNAQPYYPSGNQPNGSIAAASPTNIVVMPGNPLPPVYTTNAGASGCTWAHCQIGGVDLPTSGWVNLSNGTNAQKCVCADRFSIGTFYARNYTTHLFYKSTDNGATWVSSTPVTGPSFSGIASLDCMRASPYAAGHIGYSTGGGTTTTKGLWLTQDGGVNWTNIFPQETGWFDFGAPAPGSPYPTIFVFWNNIEILMSTDYGANWITLHDTVNGDRFPGGWPQAINVLGADGITAGKVFAGYQTAWTYGQYHF